jgi:hypothetical protein
VVDFVPQAAFKQSTDLYDRLSSACAGENIRAVLSVCHFLLVKATMEAKQCDKKDAIVEIINRCLEFVAMIREREAAQI